MSKDKVLTTVYVNPKLFETFKIEGIKWKFTQQKLFERSMHLFVTDPEFRKKIINHVNLELENQK